MIFDIILFFYFFFLSTEEKQNGLQFTSGITLPSRVECKLYRVQTIYEGEKCIYGLEVVLRIHYIVFPL